MFFIGWTFAFEGFKTAPAVRAQIPSDKAADIPGRPEFFEIRTFCMSRKIDPPNDYLCAMFCAESAQVGTVQTITGSASNERMIKADQSQAGADGNAMLKMALRVWQREKRNGAPRSIPNSAGHQVSAGDRRPGGGGNTSAAHGAVVSDDGHTRVHCDGGVGDRLLFQLSRSAGIF